MPTTITASIVGASGYSGAELLGLLSRHPRVRVDRIFAAGSAGSRIDEIHPRLAGRVEATLDPFTAEASRRSDVVFTALPSGGAMQIVPELLDRGKKVVDLSGDFRLPEPGLYTSYYGHEHVAAHLLDQSVYGLPEWNAPTISGAGLVANPGCYPTSAILPLAPILAAGLLEPEGITIVSMSGTSGAGRTGSLPLSFSEVNENVRAYKVGEHQHIPEIETALAAITGRRVTVSFVPHLLPITRGIYTNIHAELCPGVSLADVTAALDECYRNAPFVRASATAIPEIRNVAHTNFIDIGMRIDERTNRLILLSAIDNLLKGAAGQAVQNMNLLFGFPETEGLP